MAKRIIILRPAFLVLTIQGLRFMGEWFNTTAPLPYHLTRLYQLLLHLTSMRGTMRIGLALRLGYDQKIIRKAVSEGYIKLARKPQALSIDVLAKIDDMMGKPPREVYA